MDQAEGTTLATEHDLSKALVLWFISLSFEEVPDALGEACKRLPHFPWRAWERVERWIEWHVVPRSAQQSQSNIHVAAISVFDWENLIAESELNQRVLLCTDGLHDFVGRKPMPGEIPGLADVDV
jgi:hypothetical protein